MDLAEFYRNMGMDSRQIVCRFQSEKRVLHYLQQFLLDPEYLRLARSIQQDDFAGAYHAAHALMGLCQNLSLTPLQLSCSRLMQALREDASHASVASLFAHVAADYKKTADAIRSLQ